MAVNSARAGTGSFPCMSVCLYPPDRSLIKLSQSLLNLLPLKRERRGQKCQNPLKVIYLSNKVQPLHRYRDVKFISGLFCWYSFYLHGDCIFYSGARLGCRHEETTSYNFLKPWVYLFVCSLAKNNDLAEKMKIFSSSGMYINLRIQGLLLTQGIHPLPRLAEWYKHKGTRPSLWNLLPLSFSSYFYSLIIPFLSSSCSSSEPTFFWPKSYI